jgi:FkbM family methyltransferase
MMRRLKALVQKIISYFGIRIVKTNNYNFLLESREAQAFDIRFLRAMAPDKVGKLLEYIDQSKAQLRQDLFVLQESNFKQNGYFVEFGAASGVKLSNTYLLEKRFGWTGILSEPAIVWHKSLRSNRDCIIETSCVWSESGSEISFTQSSDAELSTISKFADGDGHAKARHAGRSYNVKTISLQHLLELYSAPTVIDYLSVDTEGSEYEILRDFDFTKYQFRVITCEHNYTRQRTKIHDLLSRNGYLRVHQAVSRFDDWYVFRPNN